MQSDEGLYLVGEAEDDHPTDHSESFGDGTQVLEILFTRAEPKRMTIAVSSREKVDSVVTLFELVTDRLYLDQTENSYGHQIKQNLGANLAVQETIEFC